MLEGARNFVAKAKEALAWAGDRVERYMCEGMQDWVGEAGRYDVIWIQWCIGSLTDEDMVVFMERCKQVRACNGCNGCNDCGSACNGCNGCGRHGALKQVRARWKR